MEFVCGSELNQNDQEMMEWSPLQCSFCCGDVTNDETTFVTCQNCIKGYFNTVTVQTENPGDVTMSSMECDDMEDEDVSTSLEERSRVIAFEIQELQRRNNDIERLLDYDVDDDDDDDDDDNDDDNDDNDDNDDDYGSDDDDDSDDDGEADSGEMMFDDYLVLRPEPRRG